MIAMTTSNSTSVNALLMFGLFSVATESVRCIVAGWMFRKRLKNKESDVETESHYRLDAGILVPALPFDNHRFEKRFRTNLEHPCLVARRA